MSSRCLRLYLGAVLTVSLAIAACDRPGAITSTPNNAAVPQLQQDQGSGNAFGLQKDLKPVSVTVTASGSNMCEFGGQGGTCIFNGGSLYVPPKTVPSHTRFTIDLTVGPYVTVSLTASSSACWWAEFTGAPPCSNDVGAAGFKNPVTLVVSKFGATPSTPNGSLFIAWDFGGVYVPQSTTDNGDTLSAQIWHFTDYVTVE
jgi:hypothetical protein